MREYARLQQWPEQIVGSIRPKPSKKRWHAVDESWTAKIHPWIDVETLTTGVEQGLPHRLGRLPGHFRDGGMPVHELPAAEVSQERLGALGSSSGVDKRLMLVELVQKSIPRCRVIALQQLGHSLVDLRDRSAVAGIEQCVGVGEEMIALPGHGREAGEPVHMIRRDALQVSFLTATLLPMIPK